MRHAPFARRALVSAACALVLWAAQGGAPRPAHAQGAGSVDYLIRLLSESDSFRVRVRAADALGSQTPSAAVTAALIGALDDSEAAVRAAAASSLGRVGDSSALSGLRGLSSDSESAVRTAARTAIAAIEGRGSGGSAGGSGGSAGGGSTGTPTYYVGVGPGAGVTGATLSGARAFFLSRVRAMSGVVVAPDGESDAAATRELRSRGLSGFFLDWTVTVEDSDAGVRCRVSIVLQDYPGRNVRAMTSGTATLSGDHDLSHAGPGIEAAITSALRSVPTGMAGARGGS